MNAFATSRSLGAVVLFVALTISSAAVAQEDSDRGQIDKENRQTHQQQFLNEHTDTAGKVRMDLWRKGVAETRRMKVATGIARNPQGVPGMARRTENLPLLGVSPVTGVQWTQIGPAPLVINAEQNFQGAGPDSGEVVDIAIDPRNSTDKIIFIAANDGGIWKSTDGGTTWAPKTDYMPSLSVGAVTLDPNNPSVVYAGTGNPFDGGGVFSKGVGLYKSVDDGETWTVLNPITFVRPGGIFSGININRIRVLTNGVILVATTQGLFRSIDGGVTFGANAPLFNDGNPIKFGFITDLKVDTATPTTVLAAISGSGVFLSTDSGATYTNLFTSTNGAPTSNFGFISIAQSTSPDNKTIYASVQDTTVYTPPPPPGAPFKGVYKSTDSGATWTLFPAAAAGNGCQCGYDQPIAVDPQNANLVYIGFQNFYVSTDDAATFTQQGGNDVHDDLHAFTFSPSTHTTGTPTTLYVGSDGGIAKTANSGGAWANLNGASGTPGIATNLLNWIDIGRNSTTNNAYTYGGMQDTGTAERSPGDAGTDWHLHIDGDGNRTVVDPSNPQNAYNQDDGIFGNTTNGGANWNLLTSAASGLPDCGGNFKGSACAAPVAVDPNNGKIVYAVSGKQLFKSTDQGNTFTSIHTFAAGVNVADMVPLDSNTIWVGLSDGTVQFSNNVNLGAGSTWTATTSTGSPNGPVTGIAVDPSDTTQAAVVYPRFCGLGCPAGGPTKHVFLTTNNGTSWSDVSGTPGGSENLPDLPLHSIVIDAGTSPHTLIVSSDAAVLRTADQGATWQVLGVGLPTVFSSRLALDSTATPSLLRIGTYGRSAFELQAASGPLLAVNGNLAFTGACAGSSSSQVLQLFNVGSTNLIVISVGVAPGGNTDFKVTGPNTPVTIQPGEEVDFTVTFTPTGPAGSIETANIQINSNDQFQPKRLVPASGVVGAGSIGTSIADTGNFGGVCIGSFVDLPMTVNNAGSCTLTVSNILPSDPEFLTPNTTFPFSVAPGTSVQFNERFQPTLPTGTRNAQLDVLSNDPIKPSVFVPVSGQSQAPLVSVTGMNNFGNVCAGVVDQQTFKVCNLPVAGTCQLNVTNVALSAGCKDFTIISNPFPEYLGAEVCGNVVVQFTPTSDGPKTCNLVVTSSDPATPLDVIPLTGTTPIPSIAISPDLAFPPTVEGNGACSVTKPFPVTNTGICPLTITGVTLGPPDAVDYAMHDLPNQRNVLPPGGLLSGGGFGIRFNPVELNRNADSSVEVTYLSDPILKTKTTVASNLCGEGVVTGARVLVTLGGVPVNSVDQIQLFNSANVVLDNVINAKLKTVTPLIPACAPFGYQREYGTVSNPNRLAPGTYRVQVTLTVAGKKETKSVTFTDNSCGFAHPVVVAF